MQTLKNILNYKNKSVTERYAKDYPNNTLSAEAAFHELKKYLWLTGEHAKDKKKYPHQSDLNFQCSMHPEMREIDDMWHTFLLFTRDYSSFCKNHFDTYIHHVPNIHDNKKPENIETELRRYLNYLHDKLGAGTVKTWFSSCF